MRAADSDGNRYVAGGASKIDGTGNSSCIALQRSAIVTKRETCCHVMRSLSCRLVATSRSEIMSRAPTIQESERDFRVNSPTTSANSPTTSIHAASSELVGGNSYAC